MNLKKFKRLLSVALSASMLLSTNMTALAAETAAPIQANTAVEQEIHDHDWQLETTQKAPTATESGWGTYVCECGEIQEGAIEPASFIADENVDDTTTAATGVTLGENTKTLIIGESYTLKATVTPENATAILTWKAELANQNGDPTAVQITANPENGTAAITPTQAGTITVTVETDNSTPESPIKATCTITVVEHTHVYTAMGRKAPSCQVEGMEAHYVCNENIKDGEKCGRLFAEKNGPAVTADELKIPKDAHQPVQHPAADANNCVRKLPVRYECKKCGRFYIDIEKFQKDTGTEEGNQYQEKTDYWTKEADLKGIESPNGHKYSYTFDWSGLNVDGFQSGKDNGVKVTRQCRNTDIGCTVSESAQAADISVTKATSSGYDCTQGGSATYTATAKFKTGSKEEDLKDNPHTETSTKIVQMPKRDKHDFEFKFVWTQFKPAADENNKLTFEPAQVTIEENTSCKVCSKSFDKTAAEMKVVLADSETFDPEKDTISCGGRKIKFVAIYLDKNTKQELARSGEKEIEVSGQGHELRRVSAVAATCDTNGNHAYFECGKCGKKFWDGDGTFAIEKESDTKIDALGHLFLQPEFDWESELQIGPAKATFECRTCKATVVMRGLTVESGGSYEKPDTDGKTCGEKAELSYPTKVAFDRRAVFKKADGTYGYNEEYDGINPITYNGFVKKQAVINHEFEILPDGIEWTDTNTNKDITQGLSATMTCKICGEEITFESTDGSTGSFKEGNTGGTPSQAITDVTGKMTITLNDQTSDYEAATCTKPGTAVYDIKITCNTHETGGIKNLYDVDGRTSTTVAALGHAYVVTSILWGDNGTTGDVGSEVPNDTVKVILECTRGDDARTGVTTAPADGSNEVAVTLAYEAITDPEAGYVKKSCMKNGVQVWGVTVTYGDEEVPNATEGQELYVRKTTASTGHKYETETANIVWDWSNYGTEKDDYDQDALILKPGIDPSADKVYAYFPCKNSECDNLEDNANGPAGSINGKWALKEEAEVTLKKTEDGEEPAGCTKSGYVSYIAKLALEEDETEDDRISKEQKFFAKATGHNWDRKVTWKWEAAEAVDNTRAAKAYKLTATVKCNNIGCEYGAGEGKHPLTYTVYTDDRDVDGNSNGCRVQITKNIQPASCEKEGWESYVAKAEFADPDKSELIKFQEGTDTFSKSMVTAALGHEYVTDWMWKGIVKDENGEEKEIDIPKDYQGTVIRYTSATAITGCKNETNSVTEPAEISLDYGIIDGEKLEQPTCDKGAVAYYTAVTESGKRNVRAIEMPALGHNPGWKINPDWDEIDENTTGIKAVQGCLNEIPEDVWTNPGNYTIKDVTVAKDDTHGPTCEKGGTVIWTLLAGGQEIGTHEITTEQPVKGAHKIDVKWETLKAVDRDADGIVTYEVEGALTCAYDAKHSKKVLLEAVAELGTADCLTPPQGSVAYTLTPVKQEETKDGATSMTDIAKEDLAKMVIIGGSAQSRPYGNTNAHGDNEVFYRITAKTSDNCSETSYPLHYRCRHCGKTYRNSSATEEINVSMQAQGHLYGDPAFRWSEDGTKVQAVFTCTRSDCPDKTNEAIGHPHTREFWAQIDGQKFVDKKPECSASENNGGKGIAYYPVKIDLSGEEDKQGFTTLVYSVDAGVELPPVPHNFIDKDGEMECQWCGAKADSLVQITFKGLNRTISEKWLERSTTSASLLSAIPAAPNQVGYRFIAWELNGAEYATQSTLANALYTQYTASNDPIVVSAKYEAIRAQGSVQVIYAFGDQTEEKAAQSGDIGVNLPVKAEAAILRDNQTYYFSHWSSNQEGTDTLGTGLSYEVFINKEGQKNVYAIYTTEQPEEQEKLLVALSDKYVTPASAANPKNKISFTFTISGLEESGFEFVDSGILYDTKDAANATAKTLNLENADAKKLVLNGVKTNTITVGVSETGKLIAVRGYLRYTDGNEIYTVYSQVEKASYNSIVNGN